MLPHMAEQWIDPARAVEIAGSAIALSTRLHAGLVIARAKQFRLGDRTGEGVLVPKEFWWAEGHEALEQNWKSGDFSTVVQGRHDAQALGVTIGLTGLLDMLPFEQRAIIGRSLSVAGNGDWVTAREACHLAYSLYGHNPMISARAIIEMAGLGFVAGRAVLAQGENGSRDELDWSWQEREWDIAPWFWTDFTFHGTSNQNWDIGRFSGRGVSPTRLTFITLTGVYFHKASLAALASERSTPEVETTDAPKRGRKPEYDWDVATSVIWGKIYRGELIPDNQAQVEKAFQMLLAKGDKEPSESTVRPYASRIWQEFNK